MYGMISEKCSCGAKFKAPLLSSEHNTVRTGTIALLTDWRENHRHEMPEAPEFADPPFVDESVSSHERLGDEFPIENRSLVGFQRNEVR